MCAAAAMLGGVFRASISLVVIFVESSKVQMELQLLEHLNSPWRHPHASILNHPCITIVMLVTPRSDKHAVQLITQGSPQEHDY